MGGLEWLYRNTRKWILLPTTMRDRFLSGASCFGSECFLSEGCRLKAALPFTPFEIGMIQYVRRKHL